MQRPSSEHARAVREHRRGGVALHVSAEYAGEVNLDDLFRLPAILAGLSGRPSRRADRPTVWLWRPPWRKGAGLVVRQYAHGGFWGRLAGVAFLGTGRMRNELDVALHALGHGVPTARPVAVRVERLCGPLVVAHYVSELLPDTENLLDFLRSTMAGRGASSDCALSADQRRRLAAAVAEAVARMHDAGIVHADLNLKNLLVRRALDAPEVFVIDFDKARLVGQVSLRQRMANLARLDRSVAKWAASRRAVTPRDRLRALRAYLGRYPEWLPQWRSLRRGCAGGRMRHAPFREPD